MMSIKQIAEKAGTSPATVSRVLNNPDYKCAQAGMREKIWKIAMEMNYTPNEAARNLKKSASRQQQNNYYIDVLMTRMDGGHADPFFDELLRCVESQIHENSCIVSGVWYQSLFSDDAKCEKANLDKVLEEMFSEEEKHPGGLIIIGKCNSLVIQKLKSYYKNIVSVNRNSTNYVIDEVLCDGRKIATMAVEYLAQLGHEKIAYVGKCHGEARYQGYMDVLHRFALDFYPEYVVETRQTEKEGYKVMQKFLQLDVPPTGIYCANDITAIGMLKCLNQYKNLMYIPSIIASDNIEESQMIKPMLSTVSLPKENMAKFALYLLVDRIRGGHSSVVRMELEGKLMIRSSCFPADKGGEEYYI